MIINNIIKLKRYIPDLIILISVIYFIGILFFEEPIEHYVLSFKNGHEVGNVNAFQLNKELFSVAYTREDLTILKLKGFRLKELNVGFKKQQSKLSDFMGMLDEANIVINTENCIAVTLESDYFRSYRFIIQHINSRVIFLFESELERKLIEKICNFGMVEKLN